ncbi:MAG: sulfotransferase family protein [Thermoanaerobaculia bacterium]|nr:sulfotransferase family protein [Thermoanaerobaculia bacterium]
MAPGIQRLYRRLRYGQPIVVVSGLPRSGTSMAMKMLEAGGVPLVVDGVRTADADNPKGYYEFEPVKDLARDPAKAWLPGARGRAVKIISHLLKELPGSYNYKVILLVRHLDEVLASQAKMLTRRGEGSDTPDERMTELLGDDLWRARYLLKRAPHFDLLELDYAQVVGDPVTAARQLDEFLGGGLDVDRMAAVVDPALYRNRA